MSEERQKYSEIRQILISAITNQMLDPSKHHSARSVIASCNNFFGQLFHPTCNLNWGIWDKKLHSAYLKSKLSFKDICLLLDINSQLMYYFVVNPFLNKNMQHKKVLDISCGNGVGSKVYHKFLSPKFTLGVDTAENLIANAKCNFSQPGSVEFLHADASFLPIASNSFDLIFNIASSHQYGHKLNFLKEVERILKPKGYFTYIDFDLKHNPQSMMLKNFIHNASQLQIIKKVDLTKMVQMAIFNKITFMEANLYRFIKQTYGEKPEQYLAEFEALLLSMGWAFIPRWKIWLMNPDLHPFCSSLRLGGDLQSLWKKKNYFYYLIQKKESK
jgi:ubiquinone/menaquinone biosynthesis C-methylase UbiE